MLTPKEKEIAEEQIRQDNRDWIFEGRAYSKENKVLFRKMAEEFANDGYRVYLREDPPVESKYSNYDGYGSKPDFSPGPLHLEIINRPGLTVHKAVVGYEDHPQ